MRIAFILSSLRLSGGVRVVAEYASRLAQRGHAVTLLAPTGTLDPDVLDELDVRVTVREAGPAPDRVQGWPAMARLTWALARAVPAVDVIISTHTPTTPAGWIARRLQPHSQLIWLYQDYREMFVERPMEDWLLRNALRWHRLALTVSGEARDELLSFAPGAVQVLGEGLSHAEQFHPLPSEEQVRDAQGRRAILFLGDMRPRKGLFDFLAAAETVYAQRADIVLWIVSKERCEIETPVPFEYTYRPERHELARLYASCALFVSASWWESFGLPPLEAMACGAPVVMTDSRGVRDYAMPGENCLMTPPQDPAALATAMLRLLDDPVLSARLAASGPPTAARYDWSHCADRLEAQLLALTQASMQ